MTTERPMFPPRAESIHAFPVQPVVDHPQFSSLSRRLSERELDPKDVLSDLFEEMLLDDPARIAELVIERLRDAGFKIVPTTLKEARHG